MDDEKWRKWREKWAEVRSNPVFVAFLDERDKLTTSIGFLVDAACRKQKLSGVEPDELAQRAEMSFKALSDFERGDPLMEDADPESLVIPTDDELRERGAKVVALAKEWREHALAFCHSVLTDQEKEHAVAFGSDKAYRRRGDSLMAKFHRRKDEVLDGFGLGYVRQNNLQVDAPLMKLYVQIRRGALMFCLSPDDQEAYDLCSSALESLPEERLRALDRAKTQSP